jgi:hypothetical protein
VGLISEHCLTEKFYDFAVRKMALKQHCQCQCGMC